MLETSEFTALVWSNFLYIFLSAAVYFWLTGAQIQLQNKYRKTMGNRLRNLSLPLWGNKRRQIIVAECIEVDGRTIYRSDIAWHHSCKFTPVVTLVQRFLYWYKIPPEFGGNKGGRRPGVYSVIPGYCIKDSKLMPANRMRKKGYCTWIFSDWQHARKGIVLLVSRLGHVEKETNDPQTIGRRLKERTFNDVPIIFVSAKERSGFSGYRKRWK